MQTRILVTAVILAAVGAFTEAASATPGGKEINQACASVGCFTGDSAGFPVTIAEPGAYYLSSNLDVAGGTGIVIDTDANVTLNLNGFSIAGPTRCTPPVNDSSDCAPVNSGSRGVDASGGSAVIRDGHILGFATGVVCDQRCSLTGLSVHDNASDGVIMPISSRAQGVSVEDCRVYRNGRFGINLTGFSGHLVRNNIIFGNARSGLRFGSGREGVVVNNTVTDNGEKSELGDSTASGNFFQQTPTFGVSAGDNSCDGSPC
jgi:parallel beta-helix repeat protein